MNEGMVQLSSSVRMQRDADLNPRRIPIARTDACSEAMNVARMTPRSRWASTPAAPRDPSASHGSRSLPSRCARCFGRRSFRIGLTGVGDARVSSMKESEEEANGLKGWEENSHAPSEQLCAVRMFFPGWWAAKAFILAKVCMGIGGERVAYRLVCCRV
jgi:hypothetical protein